MKKKILLVVGSLAVGWGLVTSVRQSVEKNNATGMIKPSGKEAVKRIKSPEFTELMEEKNAFILDVHTPEQTHIPGSDAFIPYDQIKQNQDRLPKEKSTPIGVYCRSGSMSAKAAEEIAALGYTNVYDLEGGTNAYREWNEKVALTPDTKELGTVVFGDVATTTFTVTNYTPTSLKITRVSTSCGCTKASVGKNELAAYESTDVHVSFDPAVHKNDTDVGDITRTIYLETDNPNFPQLESTITATVIKKS